MAAFVSNTPLILLFTRVVHHGYLAGAQVLWDSTNIPVGILCTEAEELWQTRKLPQMTRWLLSRVAERDPESLVPGTTHHEWVEMVDWWASGASEYPPDSQ